MKKLLSTLTVVAALSISHAALAASGCQSLLGSWKGQALVVNMAQPGKTTTKSLSMNISKVTQESVGQYTLAGTINNYQIEEGFFTTCSDDAHGINSLSIKADKISLMVTSFLTDAKNPTKLTKLFGKIDGQSIETTSTPESSYLTRT